MKAFSKILLFLLVFLTGLAGIAFYWTFYRPLPDYDDTLLLPGLHEKVNIHWDPYGVPHIYASNTHDLYYSAGYAHAQDRLWQMTLTQMASQGRLAEFLGKDLLPYDQFQRTIGFWRIAQKMEQQLSDSTRRILQAYAKGVNAYVKKHPRELPLEFALADMKPIPWTATHSLALARMMAWELNIAWKTELNYSFLHNELTEDQFNELFPGEKRIASFSNSNTGRSPSRGLIDNLMPLLDVNESLQRLMGTEGSHVGSNAWAVNAGRTSTGYPLLAGDPHLGLNIPGKWYEMHLNLNGKNLSGASLPGAPIMVLGQNDSLAWSMTNIMLDDTDFYEEAVNPDNAGQYVLDSLAGEALYEPFTVQREVIKIRDADDTTFTRRVSKHGPVISDIYPNQELVGNKVITLKWTGHEITNEIEALIGMGWARSFDEFRQAMRRFRVPGQNIIYADKAGNIARFSAANVPLRTSNPILVRPGWKPEQDWQGYVPFDQLPKSVNPDKGWVANANNPTAGPAYPHYLSVYWEPDSRYNRISRYLSQNEVMTPQIFQVMQNDTYSDFAREMTEYILPVLKEDNTSKYSTVISYLGNWDFNYEPSETAASIMDVFMLRLSKNVFRDEMGADAYESFIRFPAVPIRALLRFMKDGSVFFDDTATKADESRKELILTSMDEALAFLERQYGSEPFEWRWEQLHTLTLKPPLFGEAAENPDAPAALKLIVNNLLSKGPYPASGHEMSLNNGEYSWNDPYHMILGPSIRRIVDFSNLDRTLSILPTGQSGNPLSEHYGDQTESWLNAQYKFLYQDSTFFEENEFKTMILLPDE